MSPSILQKVKSVDLRWQLLYLRKAALSFARLVQHTLHYLMLDSIQQYNQGDSL